MSALAFKFFSNGRSDLRIDDHRLLRRAYRVVIKASPAQDVGYSLLNVRGGFDVRRHISRANPERRLTRGISRPDKPDPARRQDHGSILVLHQGFGPLDA